MRARGSRGPVLSARDLDRRVRVERPVPDTELDGAGSGTWVLVTELWANVQDALPSRGERLADGISVASRPARVRMRFRSDITSDMRFVMGGRIMQIISGPAELGRRDGLEF
ncbi:MAG: hypothetical protein JWO16_1272, partial [Sphingomonas bacterium]|nr:hypothetical protein [Sphingomonas bacterium]